MGKNFKNEGAAARATVLSEEKPTEIVEGTEKVDTTEVSDKILDNSEVTEKNADAQVAVGEENSEEADVEANNTVEDAEKAEKPVESVEKTVEVLKAVEGESVTSTEAVEDSQFVKLSEKPKDFSETKVGVLIAQRTKKGRTILGSTISQELARRRGGKEKKIAMSVMDQIRERKYKYNRDKQ